MSLLARQVTVTTGAAIELSDGVGGLLAVSYTITVKNTDATNPVYLGPTGVTSATGYQLAAGEALSVDLAIGEKLFARATGGSVVVGVLETKF